MPQIGAGTAANPHGPAGEGGMNLERDFPLPLSRDVCGPARAASFVSPIA